MIKYHILHQYQSYITERTQKLSYIIKIIIIYTEQLMFLFNSHIFY